MTITTVGKLTVGQNHLHAKSAHPLSLKKSIPCSQALRKKRVSQLLMNTKSIQMTWLNDSWKKDTQKNSFATN